MTVLAVAGPSAYWYLSRGTGAVSLVLLTASVVIGIVGSLRFAAPRWPRFAIDTLHRDISLLVMVVLAAHILTSVLDQFAPIRLTDAIIPFASTYRPLWLGLGAMAFDLILALIVTSLVRRRLGYRAWRAIHWLAYASWPVAVVHGLGTGSDVKVWWMELLTVVCLAAVLGAAWTRLARAEPHPYKPAAAALSIVTPIVLAVFALAGPLQKGWARRAGTPKNLLPAVFATARRSTVAVPVAPALHRPFSARLEGTISQTQESSGAVVDLTLRVSGAIRGWLRVRLAGLPLPGGGLSLMGSQVDLAAAGAPAALTGTIVTLHGQQFVARVAGPGASLSLSGTLIINGAGDTVSGTLSGRPV